MADIDLPLVLVTLTGSLLSLLGTSFILICYIVLPQKRHIRHALIINLTVAGMCLLKRFESRGKEVCRADEQ